MGGPLGDPLGASLSSLVSSLGLGIASRFRPQSCGLGPAFLGLGRGCDSCQSSSRAGRKMASRSGMSGWRPAASASFLRSNCRARSAWWAPGALECRGGKVPPFLSKPPCPWYPASEPANKRFLTDSGVVDAVDAEPMDAPDCTPPCTFCRALTGPCFRRFS